MLTDKSKDRFQLGILSLILFLGFALRLDQYLFNRSLWLDEAFFAIDVVEKNWFELLRPPLEYSSYVTPPGFLSVVKLNIFLFGNSDIVLRLFPFACGVLSLFLYPLMARQYISKEAVPYAVFFFSLSSTLILYSSMYKQYSSDVFMTIILYMLAFHIKNNELNMANTISLIITGVIAVTISYSSSLVLAAIGFYLSVNSFLNREWRKFYKLTVCYMFWIVGFGIVYFCFINVETITSKYLIHFWKSAFDAFMPNPFSLEGIKWIYNKYYLFLKNTASLQYVNIAVILTIIGAFSLCIGRTVTFISICIPMFLALILSHFQIYAFADRLLIFILPFLYLILAEGISKLRVKSLNFQKVSSKFFQIALALILILIPLKNNKLLKRHHVIQEIKPVLKYLQTNIKNDEKIYLYHWAEPAFRYYAEQYGFDFKSCNIINPIPIHKYVKEVDFSRLERDLKPISADDTQCILGVSELFKEAKNDLNKLKGHGNVWFVFSHLKRRNIKQFLNYLDKTGIFLDEHREPGSSIYLYKM